MKTFTVLLILFIAFQGTLFSQPCLQEGVWFYYQSQIDNFQTDNPDCTVIEGDVKIYGPLIKNLNGLSVLTGFEGDLKIVETDSLSSLTGLDNVTFIGGSLVFEENHMITSLTGLNSLSSIDENLFIDFNDQFASFSGLNSLATIGGNFYVRGNNALTNFTGLDELSTIQGHFFIGYYYGEDQGNSNLTDFTGLNSLNYIGGELYIRNNNSLTGTTGLNNLTYFGGGLIISENEVFADLTDLTSLNPVNGGILIKSCPILTSLNGLNNLISIEGLMIEENPLLTSLSGLENLTYIRYWLSLYKDSSLTNIDALNKVTSVSHLEITHNPSLTNLSGLISLDSVKDDLNISSNDLLINLDGLDNLHYVSGSVWINNNDVLTSLAALDNLNSDSITWLYINQNPNLATCNVPFICNFLANPKGSINIYNNAPGCNNPPEIARQCGITLPCLPYGDYYLFTQADIDSFQVNYPNCTEITGNLAISGSDITNLAGLNLITSVSEALTIRDNEVLPNLLGLDNLESVGYLSIGTNGSYGNRALISLSGLGSLVSVEGPMIIGPNPSLTNLTGLENLKTIVGELSIRSNNNLISLTGLNSLYKVSGGIDIDNNDALTSLTGLDNIKLLTGGNLFISYNDNLSSLAGIDNIQHYTIHDLYIRNNPVLSFCEVQSICDYLVSPHGEVGVNNNGPGCNNEEEVLAACEVGIGEPAVSSRQSAVSIFPNPSSTQITIEISATNPKFQICIFNLNGQEVISQKITAFVTTIDISQLKKGLYFVKLTDDNAVKTLKFIKK